MNIPDKPKGGSLDLELLVNHHFPYMRRPVMKGDIMPGVDYDYAVRLITQNKAIVAGTQMASKVNEDGTTGEEKRGPASVIEKLQWDSKQREAAAKKAAATKDAETKDSK